MAFKSESLKGWAELTRGEQEIIKRKLLSDQKQDIPKVGGKPNKSSFQLKGYVRCELSSADKDAFKAWESDADASGCLDLCIKAVDSGYLFKVGESGNAFQASLCAATTGKEWDGYVLTAHAAYASRAVALLVFKHAHLMHEDWSAFMAEDGEDFFR